MAAPEEAIGVGLLEGGQPWKRALVVGKLPARPSRQKRLERVEQLVRAREALRHVLGETTVDHALEPLGKIRRVRAHCRHRLVEIGDVSDQCGAGGIRKRMVAGDHLEQHHAERPQIGSVIDVGHAELLGRHVRQRAEQGAARGQSLIARSIELGIGPSAPASPLWLVREQLRDPEVEHLDAARMCDEHVLGF